MIGSPHSIQLHFWRQFNTVNTREPTKLYIAHSVQFRIWHYYYYINAFVAILQNSSEQSLLSAASNFTVAINASNSYDDIDHYHYDTL